MHKIDPNVKLYVNEGQVLAGGSDDNHTRRGPYAEIIRYLLDQDAPLDGIGFMGHFNGRTLTPPTKIYQILEQFARFNKDLQVTEFDVNDVPEDLQRDYLRDFMTVCFSHPQVVGFIMWGFYEKAHWKPQAALFRADWSIKPAGKVWKDLVFHQWWTKESGRTVADGTFKVCGFCGSYSIKVKSPMGAKTVDIDLPPGGAKVVVQTGP
jgi:GH35 family endo-1,4-beta-xylanase